MILKSRLDYHCREKFLDCRLIFATQYEHRKSARNFLSGLGIACISNKRQSEIKIQMCFLRAPPSKPTTNE